MPTKIAAELTIGDSVRLFNGAFGDGRVIEINHTEETVTIARPFIEGIHNSYQVSITDKKTRLYMKIGIEHIELTFHDRRPIEMID